MSASRRNPLSATACPLLGLVQDRQSRFEYPHPSHRCFAAERPWAPDARAQSALCLGPGFGGCERYRVWQQVEQGRPEDTPLRQARPLAGH